MEWEINWKVVIIFLVLQLQEVKMEDEVVTSSKMYSCWGGCYNNCFLLQKNDDSAQSFQCYFNCLNNCTTSSSALDFQSVCRGGCYLEMCIPLSFGNFIFFS